MCSLSEKFQSWNLSSFIGETVLENLSAQYDGKIFPPYIPFTGKYFSQYKILVYCTAQNISKNSELVNLYAQNFDKLSRRLEYGENFSRHYGETNFEIKDIDINPFESGVIPALIAIFILAKYSNQIKNDEIIHYSGVTNYYKFSLNSGSKDLNPEDLPNTVAAQDKYRYWALNDELVKEELKELAPRSVISFKGSKIRMLATHSTEIGYNLYAVNDPSWLLRGAKGIKAWKTEYVSLDLSVKELVDEYAEKLSGRYLAKKESVKWYLAHYYNEWKI